MTEDPRDLLDAFRDVANPSPEREAAVLERLEMRAAGGDPGPQVGGGVSVGAGVKALAVLAAVAGPAIYLATRDGQPAAPVERVSPTLERPTATLEKPAPEVRAPPASGGSETSLEVDEAPPRAAKPPASIRGGNRNLAPKTDDLQVEVELMQRALGAQRSNDHRGALKLLDEHARRFRNGTMAGERMLARATSLCELGRAKEARKEAERVASSAATKHLAPRAAKICAP